MAIVAIPANIPNCKMFEFIFSTCDIVKKLYSEPPKFPGDKNYNDIYHLEGHDLPVGKVWIDFVPCNKSEKWHLRTFQGTLDGWYNITNDRPMLVKWYIVSGKPI